VIYALDLDALVYGPYGDDAFKVAVLGRGYKYTPIGLNQKDSQYIESRTFSVEEVARMLAGISISDNTRAVAQEMLRGGGHES